MNPTIKKPTKPGQLRHLPRLDRSEYRGAAYVHWGMTIAQRASGWLTAGFHRGYREILLHACARYRLSCPAYCLMPDHIHQVWIGQATSSDQRPALEFLRKQLRPLLAPRDFQHQAYDHVLRERDRERGAFETVATYILQNPERAKLVGTYPQYEFLGCMLAGYPELDPRMADYWPRFWRAHAYLCRKDRATC